MFSFLRKRPAPQSPAPPEVQTAPPDLRADMLLLDEFAKPKLSTEAAKHWSSEAKADSLARLIDNGDLVRSPVAARLNAAYVLGDLKALLKERGLAVAGAKPELVQRLIDAGIERDPGAHNEVYQCSEAAAVKLAAWQSQEQEAGQRSINHIVALLSARKVGEAQAAAVNHQRRFFGKNSLDDRANALSISIPSAQSQRGLEHILRAKPGILSGLTDADLERVRLSASLIELGCNQFGVWRLLLESVSQTRFHAERLPMLVLRSAKHAASMASLKSMGIQSLTAVSIPRDCPSCHDLNGQVFTPESAPEIPNPTCELDGCTVILKPIFDHEHR